MQVVKTQALPLRGGYLAESLKSVATPIVRAAINVGRYILREHRNRKAVATLRGLDQRMLKDIGIDRSEIVSVVYSGRSYRS